MIGVIDCGIGNVGSIVNMLKRIGAEATAVTRPEDLSPVEKVILPGVGAFDAGMTRIEEAGLAEPLREGARRGKPLLGICLGAQLLTRGSEEGQRPGLALIDAECRRFRPHAPGLKVPHMGWNHVRSRRPSPLFDGLDEAPRFYFVHSYYIDCQDAADVLATTDYGLSFASAVQRGSMVGVQFHPEKSHRFGMRLLRSFAERFA